MRRYFVEPISEEQIDALDAELRKEWPDEIWKYQSAFESPTSWRGTAWNEEFTARGTMTPSDLLLMLADMHATRLSPPPTFPEHKLYLRPEYIGVWEQLAPIWWKEGETRIRELDADGSFRTNIPDPDLAEHPYWGVARGVRRTDPGQLLFREHRRGRGGVKAITWARVTGDELEGGSGATQYRLRRLTPAVAPPPPPAEIVERCRVFTVYLVDTRDADAVRQGIEDAFDVFLAPTSGDRLWAEAFGGDITLRQVAEWPEGKVYCLIGSTSYERPDPDPFAVGGGLAMLMRAAKFQRVIGQAEVAHRERELAGHREPLPVVRSAEEAYVYMAAHPCSLCDRIIATWRSRLDDIDGQLVTHYDVECDNCGAYRWFDMALDEAMPPPHTDDAVSLGAGTSRALDAGQLAEVARRIVEWVQDDRELIELQGRVERDKEIYQLRLAAGVLDEALKLAPADAELGAKRVEVSRFLAALRAAPVRAKQP